MSTCGNVKRIEVVNVPGVAGNNGTAGANGQNAYTSLTSDLTIPAVNASVTALVVSSLWMAVGMNLFIGDGTNFGNFQVQSFPGTQSVTLKFLGYPGDASPGATIATGAQVVAAGIEGPSIATPVSIANGGTNAATVANAQINLGLGQDALTSSSTGLTQTITNSFVQVGTVSVTIPNAGTYLYLATAIVSWAGVTFASSRNITFKIRNTTQGVDLASVVVTTGTATTATFPSSCYTLPFTLDNTPDPADVLQLLVDIDTVNTAGTLEVISGSLCAIPLRYQL